MCVSSLGSALAPPPSGGEGVAGRQGAGAPRASVLENCLDASSCFSSHTCARVLAGVAFFLRKLIQKRRKRTFQWLSGKEGKKRLVTQWCPALLQPHGLLPTRLLHPWNSPGKNTGVVCHSLLHGILPTQGTNLGLLKRQADSLPSEPSGKEFTCRCRGHGFDPWFWKIPHAVGQLSPCLTTTEPALCNRRSHDSEEPTRCNGRTPTRSSETPRSQMGINECI